MKIARGRTPVAHGPSRGLRVGRLTSRPTEASGTCSSRVRGYRLPGSVWLASSSSFSSPIAPISPIPRSRTGWSIRQGKVVFTGDDISGRAKGLPRPRPHGVRLDLRTRRLPGPRLHRPTTCIAPRPQCVTKLRVAARQPRPARRPSTSFRPTATTPTPTPCRSVASRRRPLGSWRSTTARSSTAPTTKYGLRPRPINDPQQIHQLTSFFAWSAWAASARRPGHNYSYTNNWPPEEQVAMPRAPTSSSGR